MRYWTISALLLVPMASSADVAFNVSPDPDTDVTIEIVFGEHGSPDSTASDVVSFDLTMGGNATTGGNVTQTTNVSPSTAQQFDLEADFGIVSLTFDQPGLTARAAHDVDLQLALSGTVRIETHNGGAGTLDSLETAVPSGGTYYSPAYTVHLIHLEGVTLTVAADSTTTQIALGDFALPRRIRPRFTESPSPAYVDVGFDAYRGEVLVFSDSTWLAALAAQYGGPVEWSASDPIHAVGVAVRAP